MNKLFACANIPPISFDTFKRYEQRVGVAIESAAKSSCIKAAEEEKAAVIEKMKELVKEL